MTDDEVTNQKIDRSYSRPGATHSFVPWILANDLIDAPSISNETTSTQAFERMSLARPITVFGDYLEHQWQKNRCLSTEGRFFYDICRDTTEELEGRDTLEAEEEVLAHMISEFRNYVEYRRAPDGSLCEDGIMFSQVSPAFEMDAKQAEMDYRWFLLDCP